jgi:hypothetical protein
MKKIKYKTNRLQSSQKRGAMAFFHCSLLIFYKRLKEENIKGIKRYKYYSIGV